MIKIFIILKPGVEFLVGSGIQAFLGLVKKYLESPPRKVKVSLTIIRAEYTENAPDIQMDISGHGVDESVRLTIEDMFKHFPGFEHTSPPFTIKVNVIQ
jgi:hypothetical protein